MTKPKTQIVTKLKTDFFCFPPITRTIEVNFSSAVCSYFLLPLPLLPQAPNRDKLVQWQQQQELGCAGNFGGYGLG